MERERHMDMRVMKTRRAIQNTFKEMICTLEADKITIKELTERAEIHRKTFYLHYTSIEALYEDMLQLIMQDYLKAIVEPSELNDIAENTKRGFTYLAAQEEYVERLICHPSYRDFCNKLFAAVEQHNRNRYNPFSDISPEKQRLITTFMVTTALDFYRQWVSDMKKVPVDEASELLCRLTCNGIYGIL